MTDIDLTVDYVVPKPGVIYCARCNESHLNAALHVRFVSPNRPEFDGSNDQRQMEMAVMPGFDAVIMMDRILTYLQTRDPHAYVVLNQHRFHSVRAATYVDGWALCLDHAGWMADAVRRYAAARR